VAGWSELAGSLIGTATWILRSSRAAFAACIFATNVAAQSDSARTGAVGPTNFQDAPPRIGQADGNAAGTQEKPVLQADELALRSLTDVIVVTANRREQNLQDTSLAISVIDGAELANTGISRPTDLSSKVPGLNVSMFGVHVQTFMRGVGNYSTDATSESAIAYSLNGVYISRTNGLGPIFFDLDRVEVLKGPQGTLYGRNASGGAINLITRRPTHEFGGYAQAEIGNYDQVQLTAAAGGGVSEKLALRAAAQFVDREGYLSDGYNDQKSFAARLSALWDPSATVSALVTAEYTEQNGKGNVPVARSQLAPIPGDPWAGPSIGDAQQPPNAFLPGGVRFRDDGYVELRVWAVSAQIDADLGPAKLTFIPAYRDVEVDTLAYIAGFPFPRRETSQQQSHELRLADDGGRLKWVAGLFYFEERQTQLYELQAMPIQRNVADTPLFTQSYAAFGDATFALTDRLRVLGGLRYTHERKRQHGVTIGILPVPVTISSEGRRSFEDVSWRAGIEYDLAPENMLFATAASGYKSGGFFPGVPAPDNSFGPEEITAFTLGSRNRFLDRRLQVNLEAFYWRYRDKQERYVGLTASTGGAGLLTTNAGRATLYGANLDVVFRPTQRVTLRTSVEYLHSRYDSFAYEVYNRSFGAFINAYPPEATGCLRGPAVPYTANDANPALQGDSTQLLDCSGQPLVRAPKWSGTVGYEHVFDLGGKQFTLGIDGQFAGGQFITSDFIGSGHDDGYFLLNTHATLQLNDKLRMTAWGRNLTRETVYVGGQRNNFSRPVSAGGDPTLFYAQIDAPRTFGVRLDADF